MDKNELDAYSRKILEKLLSYPLGLSVNELWRELPKTSFAKETFLDRLHLLQKCGAVKITPLGVQKKIVTLVPQVANEMLKENALIIPDEDSESEQQNAEDQIPTWFRVRRLVMERIETALSPIPSDDENHETEKARFDQFKLSLGKDICNKQLFVTPEICSDGETVWDYVSNVILHSKGNDKDILSFLLYEVRTALFLQSYRYIQRKQEEMEEMGRRWKPTTGSN